MLSVALPGRYALVPWLAAAAGLRQGETFGLARKHVSLDARTIRIDRALQETNGVGTEFDAPKTADSVRTVVMPLRLLELLQDHLTSYVEAGDDSLLFTNTRGRPIRSVVWRDAWSEARESVGLNHIRLYDLRHLAGTLNAQTGATLKETMTCLGHSSAKAALRYQHVASERAAEIAGRMDKLL